MIGLSVIVDTDKSLYPKSQTLPLNANGVILNSTVHDNTHKHHLGTVYVDIAHMRLHTTLPLTESKGAWVRG